MRNFEIYLQEKNIEGLLELIKEKNIGLENISYFCLEKGYLEEFLWLRESIPSLKLEKKDVHFAYRIYTKRGWDSRISQLEILSTFPFSEVVFSD